MNRPMMMDGADNSTSFKKRVAGASQPRLPYSAKKVPARMPMGVPMAVPTRAIKPLPIMAFMRPPSAPGGGVGSVNRVSDRALPPFTSSVKMIQASQNRPNTTATDDSVSMTRLTMRRIRYTRFESLTRESDENIKGCSGGQCDVPSPLDRRSSSSFEKASTTVVIRNRIRPSSSNADFCMPPASLNSLARADAMEFDGEKMDCGRLKELPMTKVTAMVSPRARPRPSMMPPMTPDLV